jgi:hypothetical protein
MAHRGAPVGVPGGDLHAQVSATVEHGRDERVTEDMRVCPGDLDAGGFGEAAQAACRSIRAPRVFSRIGPRTR